jgi:hypothetical protein
MSIPIGIALCPFTTHPGAPIGDQTGVRGGLNQVGVANAAAGGGPVYVAICSGAVIEFDPANGNGTLVKDTGTYGPKNYIRFDGSRAMTQPGFDWINLGGDSRMFWYMCQRTDV